MMRFARTFVVAALLAAVASIFLVFTVSASGKRKAATAAGAALTGYQEVPSISTRGHGRFRAEITGDSIQYRLSYADLESTAQAAHIHLGQRGVNGAVIAFLCGGGGKPACPPSGTVTGTIRAADVVPVPAQGIAANEIGEVIRAIRAGATYANVHTTTFSGGEIRGQISGGRNNNGDRDNGKRDDDD